MEGNPPSSPWQPAVNISGAPPPEPAWGPPPLRPAVAAASAACYSLLFAWVYAQLWLVLRYGHKRFSYRTAFLFLCLLWAGLRALLFCFGLRGRTPPAATETPASWLLLGLPVCLQFFTLALLNLYCAQVYFKAKSKHTPALLKHRRTLYFLFVGASLLFLLVNLLCGLMARAAPAPAAKTLVLVRVAVNGGLFVLAGVSLSVCLRRLAAMSLASVQLEAQVTLVGVAVVLLYASRASYNLAVVAVTPVQAPGSPDHGWFHVSDQADLHSPLGDGAFMDFGLILFVWELLPTSLLVFFFRVRRPLQAGGTADLPNHVLTSRGYFFDNPRRYDSDEDLAWGAPPPGPASSCSDDWSSCHSDERRLTAAAGELHPFP